MTAGPPAVPARRPWGPVLAGALLAFALVRLACTANDLWLDEIWSLRLVQGIRLPWQILTRIRLDNNHPLNSLFLWTLGPSAPAWAYRLLSVVCGSAAVALAALLAGRQYRYLHPDSPRSHVQAARLFAAVLLGGSYLQIHYSSEARGYAPALAFSLLAAALATAPSPPNLPRRLSFGLACALALLAHAVAAQALVGFVAFAAVRAAFSPSRRAQSLAQAAAWLAAPLVFFAAYYTLFLRPLAIGGGTFLGQNHAPISFALGDAAAFTLGLPASLGSAVALPLLLAGSLLSLALLFRRDAPLASLYAAAIYLAPLPGVFFAGEQVLYPRYFILSAAGALLLCAYGLARAWASFGRLRLAVPALLALFLLGNAVHVAELLRDGRGQYRQALRYLLAETPSPTVTVSSDFNDFRNALVVQWHAPAVAGPGRAIVYIGTGRWRRPGPDWLLTERLDREPPPPDHLYDAFGTYYQLDRSFPHAPLSGWTWYLYRNTLVLGFPRPDR